MLSNKYFSVEQCSSKERFKIILFIFLIFLTGMLGIYASPTELLFHWLGIETINGCPLLTFTGVPCPFCGMGRAFVSLENFDIKSSFYYNPLGLIFYVISGTITGIVLVLSIMRKKIVLKKPSLKLWYLPVVFLTIMWILNILFGHHN
jgi:hypothetical protein